METNKDLIVIDIKELAIAKDQAGDFIVTPNAEEQIVKLLNAQKLLEDWIDQVKEKLGAFMTAQGLLKVKGENLSVSKRYYGERFALSDQEVAEAGGFATQEVKYKVDPKNVEGYIKNHEGKLPEGVVLRERNQTVSISMKGGGKDE